VSAVESTSPRPTRPAHEPATALSRRSFVASAAGAAALGAGGLPTTAAAAAPEAERPAALARRALARRAGGGSRVRPYRVHVPRAVLRGIRRRVAAADPPEAPWADGFEAGASPELMAGLRRFWLERYDWRAQERGMNRFPHFTTEIEGEHLHFVRVQGTGRRAPLVLLHGWPYSFRSFLPVVDRLARPGRHGGDPAEGRDVIVPSLPGFGFSDRPAEPLDVRQVTARIVALMTDRLGHPRFAAHGGDLGAGVLNWLGYEHGDRVTGLHFANSVSGDDSGRSFITVDPGPGPLSPEQREGLIAYQEALQGAFGYFLQQSTRPVTVGYLVDSPLASAAWIVDKYHAWSDRRERSFLEVFSRTELLTECLLYIATGRFDSAFWLYHANYVRDLLSLPAGWRVATPTGVAAFPDPFIPPTPRPPAAWAG